MPSLGPFLNSQKSHPHFLTHVFLTCGPVLHHVGEKPTVILRTYINAHAGIPDKTKAKDTRRLDYNRMGVDEGNLQDLVMECRNNNGKFPKVAVVVVDSHIQRKVRHRPIKFQPRSWSQRGTKVNAVTSWL